MKRKFIRPYGAVLEFWAASGVVEPSDINGMKNYLITNLIKEINLLFVIDTQQERY